MKIQIRLLMVLCIMICFSGNSYAFSHYITFTGAGAGTTVDSVVVQNLSKGTQVTVPAGFQLELLDVWNSIDELITITDLAYVFPNPATENATFTFVAKNNGKTQIAVYGIDGKQVTGLDIDLHQGKNSFQLTLPKGVYLIQAKGKGFSHISKVISLRMKDCFPMISFRGNITDSKPQKVTPYVVKLQYSTGDHLLYKGYSGNYRTIVTDKPTETKTTDFKFVDCTDADGNHYAVVHIGSQTWMAENLKTTKYRNGEALNKQGALLKQFAYNAVEDNAAKYGRLYTWYAVADTQNIAPKGWHVPVDVEWTTLFHYLGANGYNYDGGTNTPYYVAKSLAAVTDWAENTSTGTIGNELSKNNKSGFTALPGGMYAGGFYGLGSESYWWTSTYENSYNVRSKYLSSRFATWGEDKYRSFDNGLYVRCVRDGLQKIETVNVPAGTFTIGSPTSEVNRRDDETQHQVTLSAFRMSKYEITNAQYVAFLNEKGIGIDGLYAAGAYPDQKLIYASSGYYDWSLHYNGTQWVTVAGYENYPIINVTWYGATEFANYAGGTLPTEAQWEYACRGGTTTPFNTGSCLTNLQANYIWTYPYSSCTNTTKTYPGKTLPVGSYAPNAYGLYDMHGNVLEWCSDWYGTYATAAQTNPTGAATASGRVIRGGGWYDHAKFCRSAIRYSNTPDFNYFILGFRLVFVP